MLKLIKIIIRYFVVIVITFGFVSSVYAVKNSSFFPPETFKLKKIDLGTDLNSNFGEITDSKVVEQSFVSNQAGLSEISLFFSTFNRNNSSNTLLFLYEADTHKLVRKTEINNSGIKDNSYNSISFEPIKDSKEKIYILKLTTDTKDPTKAITLWKDNDNLQNGNLSFLGKHEEGSLVGKLVYQIQFEMLDIIINGVFFSILNIFLFELLRFIKNR